MAKARKGLRLLDGFRQSSPDSPHTHAGHHPRSPQKQDFSQAHRLEPSIQDVVSTLKVMEQRLGSLLKDHSHSSQSLHDYVHQSLDAIGANIQIERLAGSEHTAATNRSRGGIAGQINRLICEIRQMIHGLNDGAVREFDLSTELRALKSIYNEIGHVHIALDLQPSAMEMLTQEEEREILHIVRQALSNCVRHAHAAHAAISIRRRNARIRVLISDDGKRFPVGDGLSRGYNLITMETRAKKIGGILHVQSEEDRGTQITVEFSLDPILVSV